MKFCEQVRTVRVEKRVNEIVNRLNKTKVERTPDLKGIIRPWSSVFTYSMFYYVFLDLSYKEEIDPD